MKELAKAFLAGSIALTAFTLLTGAGGVAGVAEGTDAGGFGYGARDAKAPATPSAASKAPPRPPHRIVWVPAPRGTAARLAPVLVADPRAPGKGRVDVYEVSRHDRPVLLYTIADPASVRARLVETRDLDAAPCARAPLSVGKAGLLAGDAGVVARGAPTKPGWNAFPSQPSGAPPWAGLGVGGGCGTWATMMCNRILGRTPADQAPNQAEWDQVAGGIGQDQGGSASNLGIAGYYQALGYNVTYDEFGGTADDYKEMEKKMKKERCDVKLFFKKSDGTNGHWETVIDADGSRAITNSWGTPAIVTGGGGGGFGHQDKGADTGFRNPDGTLFWPPDQTVVKVMYVCPD